ncbi:MAG: hypothetical protein A2V65_03940 [Deltaproteobacteria bacterium RBG_13_49_15]|nr:MAG: hypothetical protein A2V65_03940 [Deltaproteobacteria bacterium RBG_13_49_15]
MHRNTRIIKSALLFACCFLFICCSGPARGARESRSIAVYLDRGGDDKATKQMGAWMEGDIKNVLARRGGYNVRIISSRDEFKSGQGEYLVTLKIIRYNPGSKAARIIVGFGAGYASLDIHYELIGPSGNTLISKDDGCATSLDWQRLGRKLNENILAAIQPRIAAGDLSPEAAVTPAPAKTTEAADPKNIAEQLRQLEELHEQKLITDDEYKQKRKKILDTL